MPGGAISFYTMLGLPQGTSTGQIRRRQLTLLRQFHPDKQLGAAGEEATKVINLAAEVLGDREKRAAYDAELVSGGSHEDGLAAAALHGGRRHKSRRASRKSKGTHRR
jgi:DnaJ-class molecular chaperone